MSARVYVGRLSHRADERDLEHFFRRYGRICDIVLKNGFGFVEFDDPRDADDAVYELNGKDLCGERVTLEFSRRDPRGRGERFDRAPPPRRDSRPVFGHRTSYGPPQQTGYCLIVENLSSRCSWQDLKDIMREAGEVTFADAHKQHANEGIVCFQSREGMDRALDKFQGKEVNGRKLKLVDNSKKCDSRSRRRSRRRSHSHSRSDSSHSRSTRSRSRSKAGSHSPKTEKGSKSRSASPRSRSASRSPEANGQPSKENGGGTDEPVKAEGSRSPTPE